MRAIASLVLASSCCIGLLTAEPAWAAASCEALRAELAQTPIVIGNAQGVRAFSGAVTRQDFEIRKLQRSMQQAGCSSSIAVLDANGRDICAPLQDSLAAMEANKRQLLDERNAVSMKGGVNPRRQEILTELSANGCDAVEAAVTTEPEDEQSTPRPYEAPVYPDYPLRSEAPVSGSSQGMMLPSGSGGYRTLCVRTCDGGFFPISPSTAPRDFGRDAETCSRLCPGTETELYYSRLTEEAKDMVSTITGQPYRDMPNAFAYLSRAPGATGQCSCTHAGPESAPASAVQASTSGSSIISITSAKTTPAPSSPLIAPGAADKSPLNTMAQPDGSKPASESQPYDAGRQSVRKVGPTFLPSSNTQIDLVHPALQGAQPVQE